MCAHFESLMCSALALAQPAAYERWLLAYVEFLAAYPQFQVRRGLIGVLRGGGAAVGRQGHASTVFN